jgi:hypothetical protein
MLVFKGRETGEASRRKTIEARKKTNNKRAGYPLRLGIKPRPHVSKLLSLALLAYSICPYIMVFFYGNTTQYMSF